MEYLLTLDFNLNNNGLELSTYWVDLVIPSRTIYFGLVIWLGVRVSRKIRENKAVK